MEQMPSDSISSCEMKQKQIYTMNRMFWFFFHRKLQRMQAVPNQTSPL